jgi:hypothetical protein
MRDVRVDLHFTNRKEKIQNPRRRSAQATNTCICGFNFCGFIVLPWFERDGIVPIAWETRIATTVVYRSDGSCRGIDGWSYAICCSDSCEDATHELRT